MNLRSRLASGALYAAAAAVVLTTAMAVPGVGAAQPVAGPQDNGTYYDPCRREQADRGIAGAVIGGIAGAVIGSNVAHGGGRTGGALIGGAAGAAVGAGVGSSSAACEPAPPPPPPGYDQGPPPPAYDREDYRDAAPPPPPDVSREDDGYRDQRCGWAQRQVWFPDGTQRQDSVRACRDDDGRWNVVG